MVVASIFFFFKQKTAYEMRISDWSSDVCSSDLAARGGDSPGAGASRSGLAGIRSRGTTRPPSPPRAAALRPLPHGGGRTAMKRYDPLERIGRPECLSGADMAGEDGKLQQQKVSPVAVRTVTER